MIKSEKFRNVKVSLKANPKIFETYKLMDYDDGEMTVGERAIDMFCISRGYDGYGTDYEEFFHGWRKDEVLNIEVSEPFNDKTDSSEYNIYDVGYWFYDDEEDDKMFEKKVTAIATNRINLPEGADCEIDVIERGDGNSRQ